MLIRCQSCQAQFSLQDGVAAAGAKFKVECGRCKHLFEQMGTGAPTQVRPPQVRAPVPILGSGSVERTVSPDELAKALRSHRPESAPRRRTGLWIAIAGTAAVMAAAVVAVAHLAGLPRRAQERLDRARHMLLRDDAQSLEQATALFTEAARMAPGEAAPEGERAFALLLQAAAHKDLADRLESLPDAAPEREQQARSATRRLQEGLAAAKAALEDDREDPAALRALALHAALVGTPDLGSLPLERAAKAAPQDPWIPWTRARLALSGPPADGKQDRALAALAVARQAEPQMIRAQVDVAGISIDRQEPGPARDVLGKVLAANPQHERAKRLLSLLPVAP